MSTSMESIASSHPRVALFMCLLRVSVEEIDQMTGLFQQKQRELLVAVSRVEELSDQLEALRSNRLEPPPLPHHHTSTAELERLYKELQVRSHSRTSSDLQRGLCYFEHPGNLPP